MGMYAGIFYINRRAKGKLLRASEETSSNVHTEDIETTDEIPVSEAIDKMSIQYTCHACIHVSYLFMKGITTVINVPAFTC